MPELATLLERFRHGDRLALSRLLSMAARGENIAAIEAALARVGQAFQPDPRNGGQECPPYPQTGKQECLPHEETGKQECLSHAARIIAITGSAGVGKSTLIGRLIEHIRKQGAKVAVLACDPQSPLTGGALLGDRFRMPALNADDGVFIRSLAALSGRGAVAEQLPLMARLLGAFGFDFVLIETVGAGQGDVTVAELADVVLLLLQPETGDDLQWEKAGVLEIADLIAVQKADLPRAEHVAAQVRAALELGDRKAVPVLLVSAKTGQNIAELWQQIAAATPHHHGQTDAATQLLRLVQQEVAARFAALQKKGDSRLQQFIEQWQQARVSNPEAAASALKVVAESVQFPPAK